MNITIDVSQMAYTGTGVGRYTFELVRALLREHSSHHFSLWAGVRKQRFYFEALSKTEPWNQATWIYSHLSPKLAGILFNYSPLPLEYLCGSADLIQLSDWTAPVTHVPAVTTVHDLAFVKYPETVASLIRHTQSVRLSRLIKHHTFVIADSLSTKNDLTQIYHLEPSTIEVIYPGVSDTYLPQTQSEISRVVTKYNLPPQFILSLGTQEPRKNLDRLIEATKGSKLPLIIAGKYGWGNKLALPPHVRTLGFVAESDLPALYSSATIFAYPSLYEGFGFPVLEAMASGVPVVTSNVSSLPEITAGAAVLVDPLSVPSIQTGLLTAQNDRAKLRKLGLVQSKKFDWSITAKQFLKIYEKIGNK